VAFEDALPEGESYGNGVAKIHALDLIYFSTDNLLKAIGLQADLYWDSSTLKRGVV
jgi:hypothetical protein